MAAHDVWHVLVLASTLFGAAGVMILVLAPLIFDTPPPGLIAARRVLVALAALAALVLLWEWLFLH